MDQPVFVTNIMVSTSRRVNLVPLSLHLREAVSQPFRIEIVATGSANLDIDRMLDMGVALRFDTADPRGRYLHGLVDRAEALPAAGRSGQYRLSLVPRLAQLSRCSNNRVFADMSVIDILADVFETHGLTFEDRTSGDHPPHEFTIQFGESDLAFVTRLMEDDGIWYYFEHDEHGHTLVLLDAADAASPLPGYATQSMLAAGGTGQGIVRFDPCAEARPTRIALDDVDPDNPARELAVRAGVVKRGESCATLVDYPGGYHDVATGAQRADLRLAAERTGFLTAHGMGVSPGIAAGRRFVLAGHARKELNVAHVVTATDMWADAGPPTAASNRLVGVTLRCDFVAAPEGEPLPLPAGGRRPDLRGPHTAVVDGPAGESIHVDARGRVQVRFPWQASDGPTPWVRVSQGWAGDGRGLLMIPRVGDEVLVAFEHGDARRPIVVGSLYNGAATPPADLPQDKMQTVLQSRSDAGVPNTLRFDDTAGSETLLLDAGRDLLATAGDDMLLSAGNDVTGMVGRNLTVSVGGDTSESIGDACSIAVGGNRTVTVGNKYTLGTAKALSIGSDDTLTLTAGKKLTIQGNHNIVIRNGKASIELQADGDVIISGERVTVKAKDRLLLRGANVVEQEDG